MKYKITVSSVLKEDGSGNEVYETVFLQVLDLEENPAADIARLLNPEPEYEEEVEEDEPELTHIEKHIENAIAHGVPAGDMRFKPNRDFERDAAKASPAPRVGRQPGFDREAMIEDIKANVLTVSQIADKYRVLKQTVYNVRSRFVSPADIAPDVDPAPTGPRQEPVDPEPTAYQESRERLEAKELPPIEKKIEEMVAEGLSMAELEMMFPSVPVSTIREIFERFEDLTTS